MTVSAGSVRVPRPNPRCGAVDRRTVGSVNVTVRTATRADTAPIASVLADAFFDDPVFSWIFRDERTRLRGSRRFFAVDAKHHMIPSGGTDIAESDGRAGGAAMWSPPGQWRLSTWQELRSLPAMVGALGRYTMVAKSVSDTLNAAHPEAPHWYLSTIGTASFARGAGYGTALLRSRLDRCDAEHSPAYLESSKEGNVPYYERFGFEVTGEIHIPDGGPTLWAMWRNPR